MVPAQKKRVANWGDPNSLRGLVEFGGKLRRILWLGFGPFRAFNLPRDVDALDLAARAAGVRIHRFIGFHATVEDIGTVYIYGVDIHDVPVFAFQYPEPPPGSTRHDPEAIRPALCEIANRLDFDPQQARIYTLETFEEFVRDLHTPAD